MRMKPWHQLATTPVETMLPINYRREKDSLSIGQILTKVVIKFDDLLIDKIGHIKL